MKFTALIVLAALGGCFASSQPTLNDSQPPKRTVRNWMIPHTYKVSIECDGKPAGGGSAVALGPDRVMTAKHVLEDLGASCSVFLVNYRTRVEVSRYWLDDKADLAVMEPVKSLEVEAAVVAPGLVGDHITVVGYPVALSDDEQHLAVTDGLVATLDYSEKQDRITAPVYFGNSGGPVWNDAGEVVGIAVSVYCVRLGGYPLPYFGVSTMVDSFDIKDFLRRLA